MAPVETHVRDAALFPLVDLNRERREERRAVYRRSRRYSAGIMVTILIAATVPLPLTLQALTLRRECHKGERQETEVRQRLQSATAASGAMDAKIGRWTQLVQSQQARHEWDVTLPALAACLPDDVSLQQIQISEKGKGTQVQLQGSAGTMTGLHTFTAALARSSGFLRLHLDETTVGSSKAGSNGVTFRMAGPLSGVIASRAEPSAR
jgi:Tfp pilus assembly protein PilN